MRAPMPVLPKDSKPPLAETMVLAAWAWVSDVSRLASKNCQKEKGSAVAMPKSGR